MITLDVNSVERYGLIMINSFADRRTAAIFAGSYVRNLDDSHQERARMRLLQIDVARRLEDLRNPPSNGLERKQGKMKELHCLRVNRQWRICFEWLDGHAFMVRLIDYQ